MAKWIVTRVWRVDADGAMEALAATDLVDFHREEAITAKACPHPLADREPGICVDCGAPLTLQS